MPLGVLNPEIRSAFTVAPEVVYLPTMPGAPKTPNTLVMKRFMLFANAAVG
jgi:hypothetical protein